MAVDVLSAVLVSYVAFRLRFDGDPRLPGTYLDTYRLSTVAVAVLWVLASRATGLYRRAALRPGTSNVEPAFEGALVVGVLLLVGGPLLAEGRLSRAWIGLVTLGLVLAGVASRGLLRRTRRGLVPLGVAMERYAVVGEEHEARRLVGDLTRAAGTPYKIVATLPASLSADELAQRAWYDNLDGLILPAQLAKTMAGELAGRLSGLGAEVLVAPEVGDLDLRVASIAMFHGTPLLRVAGMTPRRKGVRVRARDRGRHGVAVLGTRGVPGNYGGFETFAERLSLGLAADGFAVSVYCRRAYASAGKTWRGIRLVTLPTVQSKYLDTVVHTALSALHLVLTRGPRDVILCNAANAPIVPFLRLFRRRVVLNVDGLEWRRTKWGVAGRTWYRLGEWLAVRTASVLVTDAEEVRTYYRVRHDSDSVMIPYGSDLLERGSFPVPDVTPVRPDGYALYVSRWERENNPVMVATAHRDAGADLDLVMLGSATYDEELGREVQAAAGPRAHLPGAVFGDGYRGLQVNAACYVHATEVGGTHPALIEALGAGNLVLVLDTPENREVVGDAAILFSDAASLAERLRWVAGLTAAERDAWRQRARDHAEREFSWATVTAAYRELLVDA